MAINHLDPKWDDPPSTLPETNIAPKKWMVGILLSCWGRLNKGISLTKPPFGVILRHSFPVRREATVASDRGFL